MNVIVPDPRSKTMHHPDREIQRVRQDSREDFLKHLLRLSDYQRRSRFNGNVSDEFIRAYCRGFQGVRSVLLGYFVGGQMRGAGELILVSDIALRRSCEIAVSVEEDYEGRGIGTALLQRILVLASNRRIRTMHVFWLHGNKRMEQLAGKFGATLTTDGYQVQARIPVPLPSDLTVFEEALSEGSRRALTPDRHANKPT